MTPPCLNHPDFWIRKEMDGLFEQVLFWNKISVEDALRAYTINGAYASFDDSIKGSIERGKLADIVIIDRDLTRIPPDQIADAKVNMTIVGGRVVYETPHH